MRPALGRVLINESWVSDGAPMSVLGPTPVANQRIWALPPVARSGLSPSAGRTILASSADHATAGPNADVALILYLDLDDALGPVS